LKRTVGLAAILTALPMLSGPSAMDPVEARKTLKVVIFGGHPDDPESGAGGLAALLTR
jgi:hypothetical protein